MILNALGLGYQPPVRRACFGYRLAHARQVGVNLQIEAVVGVKLAEKVSLAARRLDADDHADDGLSPPRQTSRT